jgi:hypothetical protein
VSSVKSFPVSDVFIARRLIMYGLNELAELELCSLLQPN